MRATRRRCRDALAERLERFKAVLDDRSLATGAASPSRARWRPSVLRAADRRRPRRACAITRSPRAAVAGIPALVARTGYTGEDGFEVFVDTQPDGRAVGDPAGGRAIAGRHARRPRALATPSGSRPACRSTATSSTCDTTPFEAGLGPGRQAGQAGRLRRPGRAREGRPRRPGAALVGLVVEGRGIARHGYPVWVGDRRTGDRDQRDAVADARRPDRDGLRRTGRRRAGYHGRCRDPRRPRPGARVVALPFYRRQA